MTLKVIIQGRLEFGSEKSYDKVFRMYEYRIENFYKNDILVREDIFDPEQHVILIPRLIAYGPKKHWVNTIRLLDYLSQFAVSGTIGAWLVKEGSVLEYAQIEPKGDKGVVQVFRKGRRLAEEEGKEEEAIRALSKAISKYDKHAQAYERRGYVNFSLGNFEDALYDFSKCLRLDDSIPQAYLWRAKTYLEQNDLDHAIEDLGMAAKKAIALQPIYWQARLLKAQCHIQKSEFEKAAFELKLFTKRKFDPSNPNYGKRQMALYLYARVLLHLEQNDLALDMIERAIAIKEDEGNIPLEQLLTVRGLAKHRSGASGKADWRKAIDMGSEEAEKLMAEYSA